MHKQNCTFSLPQADWPVPFCLSVCLPAGLGIAVGCSLPQLHTERDMRKGHCSSEIHLNSVLNGECKFIFVSKCSKWNAHISVVFICVSHTCRCRVFSVVSSFSTSQIWLVALANSARSRSLSARSCSMCCCFSFRASCRAVVPEIFRAYLEDVSVNCQKWRKKLTEWNEIRLLDSNSNKELTMNY